MRFPFALTFLCLSLIGTSQAKARRPVPGHSEDVYSLTRAQLVPITAKKTRLPLIVYGDSAGTVATYVPSGYMGDADSLRIKGADFSAPLTSTKTGSTCLRIEILPHGREGWVGLYWQTPANNWGKIKGAGYDLSKAEKLTFWARGENGGERVGDFKVGGLVGPYPDTDVASTGSIRLNKEWTAYTINLKGKDLRHIVGGFSFSARRSDNPHGAVFYLDEIYFSGPEDITVVDSSPAAKPVTAAPVVEPTPTPPATPKLGRTIKIVVPFSSAKTAFKGEGRESLDEVAAVAKKFPESKFTVDGHTDNVGSKVLNKKLSFERAGPWRII